MDPLSSLGEDETETCHSGDTIRDLRWPEGSTAMAPISSITAEILLLGHTEVPTSPQTHPALLHFPEFIATVPSARDVLSSPKFSKFYLSFKHQLK